MHQTYTKCTKHYTNKYTNKYARSVQKSIQPANSNEHITNIPKMYNYIQNSIPQICKKYIKNIYIKQQSIQIKQVYRNTQKQTKHIQTSIQKVYTKHTTYYTANAPKVYEK